MSGASSSVAEWFSLLEPANSPLTPIPVAHGAPPRGEGSQDDPRLGDIVEFWQGDPAAFRPGRAVLVGFPQDEGVRRNHGRPGAAEAPVEIRRWLYRLTPWDAEDDIDLADHPPLDAGNLRITGDLEETQHSLSVVIAGILLKGAVPIVLGGGHETAYGHYLGYISPSLPRKGEGRVGIINMDAHLDVRPPLHLPPSLGGDAEGGLGHSGSPFRQALEHPTQPLPGTHYVCLGAQPHSVSRKHWLYAREHGCTVRWASEVRGTLAKHFCAERERLAAAGCQVYVTIDADVVQSGEVPGVSAPNALGLSGREVISCARTAGQSAEVASIDLVEINPRQDQDGQSCRWGALVVWNFLIGLAARTR